MRRLARLLLYVGIPVIVATMGKAHASIVADLAYDYTGGGRTAWTLAYALLLIGAVYGFGLPDLPRTPKATLGAAIGAAFLAAIGISVVQLLVGDALLPRFVVFGSAIVVVPWALICAALAGGGQAAPARDRVLVVSDGIGMATLRHELTTAPERPAVLVDVMSVGDARGTEQDPHPLLDPAKRHGITILVLDRDAQTDPTIVNQAAMLHESGVRVRTLSLFYEGWLGKLPLSELERVSLMFDIGELHRARYARLKRVVDITFGALGVLVLAVLVPFVLIGNLVGNRGPIFYSQMRVGKNGSEFRILKLRTMRSEDEGTPNNSWTTRGDPRITPFGRLLRRTHLDELPQVVNVVRGELSIVGPRPEQPHYVLELTDKLPLYRLRHLIRPGLTGWAQVKYHYASNEADAMQKLQYEFYYLRHQRLSLDLRIIGRTIRQVLGQGGR